MDPGTLALMIPIVAIVSGIGAGVVQTVLKSQERRLEMRLRLQQGQEDEVLRQVQALRAEVAALRDTSTQFDLSLEQTVQALERRMGQVEAKPPTRSYGSAPIPEEEAQQIGVR